MVGRLISCLEITAIFGAAVGANFSGPAEAGQRFPKEHVSRAHIEWCYEISAYRLLGSTSVDANGQRPRSIAAFTNCF
ncbi:hypothetical protein [Mesorhizobium temperatum]|uniref:Uncharacterized protein n=1 Tax=Mesorhizobium temperatum TaxID=241416 RepID=A0A271LC16_9HYPH|nr:hypothetical protein [Mesorhizobium temperatum]PAQ05427.1 hypothetical protein CIT26_30425 [Mesorhizobium temperatum]